MNKGIGLASGDWILFMNADDSFYNFDVLSNIFNTSQRSYDVIYGDSIQYDENMKYLVKAKSIQTLPKKMPFMHQAVFVRTGLYRKYKFDLSYQLCADYDFFFKLYEQGYSFKQVDVIVCNYYIGGASGKGQLKALAEVIKIKEKYSLIFRITVWDRLLWNLERCKFMLKLIVPNELISFLRKRIR